MLAAHMDTRQSRPIARSCRVSGARPRWRTSPGLKAVDLFQAIDDGPRQGGVDHGHQSGRQPARRRFRPRGARRNAPSSSSPTWRKTPTPARSPMCCCRRSPGARRTARSPIPSAAFRASARCARRRARRAPTGDDHLRRRAPHGFRARPLTSTARRRFSANMRRCPASRMMARAISTFRPAPNFPTCRLRCARAVSMANPRGRQGQRRAEPLFRRRQILHAGPAARISSPRRFAASPIRSTPSTTIVLNTGRMRDQWHTMTRTGRARATSRSISPNPSPNSIRSTLRDSASSPLASCGFQQRAWLGAVSRADHRRGKGAAPCSRRSIGPMNSPPPRVWMFWSRRSSTPISGQPECKATPVAVEPFDPAWYAFALTPREARTSRLRLLGAGAHSGRLADRTRRADSPTPTGSFSRAACSACGAGEADLTRPAR